MNMSDKCKNCGGERGLHHYETNQCPVGGQEAAIGRKQEWKKTTFELETVDEVAELRASVEKLISIVEELKAQVDRLQSGSELEESVRVWGTGQ